MENDTNSQGDSSVTTEKSATKEAEELIERSLEQKRLIEAKIKKFLVLKKKIIAIILCAVFIVTAGVFVFNSLWDFTKIKWDDKSDASLTYASGRELELKVIALDKENKPIKKIKFEAQGGEIQSNEDTVKWVLPDQDGEYKIAAIAPRGKKIEKTINLVRPGRNKKLAGVFNRSEKEDENTDDDKDGLTNIKERELGLKPRSADTDWDGLIDGYEVNISKTDPKKADTDDDGLLDGDEIALGLDPLKADSKGDGIKDSERKITYDKAGNQKLGVDIKLTGSGNLASTTVDKTENRTLVNTAGVLPDMYDFNTSGKVDNAEVTIKYDIKQVQSKKLKEADLSIYHFDDNEKKFTKIDTKVNTTNKTVSANLAHFSKYVIADVNAKIESKKNRVLFIIDNSGSMYTPDQMKAQGHSGFLNNDDMGNDPDFKRVDLTRQMIDQMTGNYEFSVAEFAGSYKKLGDFTDEREKIKDSVEEIRRKNKSPADGTRIANALEKGMESFGKKVSSDSQSGETFSGKYIFIMTDGDDTENAVKKRKEKIIETAKSQDIKICAIGLGKNLEKKDLSEIAEKTGCEYSSSDFAEDLDDSYNNITAAMDFGLTQVKDISGPSEWEVLANTGFSPRKNGFSFDNFSSNKSEGGHCYGMATFARLRFQKKLPPKLGKHTERKVFGIFGTYESDGYDLSGTKFVGNDNLGSFKFTTPALRIVLQQQPKDYRSKVVNSVYSIDDKYKSTIQNFGINIVEKDISGYKDFSKYEDALINIGAPTLSKNAKKDESQLLNAIWRLHILQMNDNNTSFISDPDDSFAALFSKLKNGEPAVISFSVGDGGHAVNAIRLLRNKKDSNRMKIAIYDNNYPGTTRFIEVERRKTGWFGYSNWTNDYRYRFQYDIDGDGKNDDIDESVSVRTPNI